MSAHPTFSHPGHNDTPVYPPVFSMRQHDTDRTRPDPTQGDNDRRRDDSNRRNQPIGDDSNRRTPPSRDSPPNPRGDTDRTRPDPTQGDNDRRRDDSNRRTLPIWDDSNRCNRPIWDDSNRSTPPIRDSFPIPWGGSGGMDDTPSMNVNQHTPGDRADFHTYVLVREDLLVNRVDEVPVWHTSPNTGSRPQVAPSRIRYVLPRPPQTRPVLNRMPY